MVGKHPALVRRLLVEDVDALSEHFIRLARQELLERPQRVSRCFVDVSDVQVFIGQHDVDWHEVEHVHLICQVSDLCSSFITNGGAKRIILP